MRHLLFTGYNQFGQHNIVERTSGCLAAFNEIQFPDNNNNDNILISPSWRYTAYAAGCKLWLQGLLDCAPSECLKVEAPLVIKALAASDTHCLVLLQNGDLYKLEAKLHAKLQQLRLETPAVPSTGTKRTIFGIAKLANETSSCVITHIACGSHINVAISADNAVYGIPSCLHQFPQRQWRVQQLVCGHEHALLLNGNGDVYSWGNGLRGQLGHATIGVEETPLLLEALAGIKITHIAAGGWHSAAISAFGDLYTWGYNCYGQLGMRVMKPHSLHHEPKVYPLPQLLDLPKCCAANAKDTHAEDADAKDANACAPVMAFAGSRHTLLMRSCGWLWASGWSAHGQLGKQLDELAYVDTFLAMQFVHKDNNYNVVCGPWATMINLSK